MNRSYIDRLITVNTERVLAALTQQQHLHPTRSVAQIVQMISEDLGYCDLVAQQTLQEMPIDGHIRIGRLSRQQIRSLAVKLESAWQATLADLINTHVPQSTPSAPLS